MLFKNRIQLVLVLFFMGCVSMPPGAVHDPLNRNSGVYKPVDQTIDRLMKSHPMLNLLSDNLKMPVIYGEYVVPYYVSDAEIGEVVIQKGASLCILYFFCFNQLKLNDYPDLKNRKIATVDLKIKSWFHLFSEMDIIISYEGKKSVASDL